MNGHFLLCGHRPYSQVGFKLMFWGHCHCTFLVVCDKVENIKYAFCGELKFLPNLELELDNIPQLISQLKTLPYKILLKLPFCYFHCLRFLLNIIGM